MCLVASCLPQVYMQISSLRDVLLRKITRKADKKRSHFEVCHTCKPENVSGLCSAVQPGGSQALQPKPLSLADMACYR